jgi:hypothetical protein
VKEYSLCHLPIRVPWHLIEVGSIVPRQFRIDSNSLVIENGVARDMLKARLVTAEAGANSPELELFHLPPLGYMAVMRFIGRDTLVDFGIVEA